MSRNAEKGGAKKMDSNQSFGRGYLPHPTNQTGAKKTYSSQPVGLRGKPVQGKTPRSGEQNGIKKTNNSQPIGREKDLTKKLESMDLDGKAVILNDTRYDGEGFSRTRTSSFAPVCHQRFHAEHQNSFMSQPPKPAAAASHGKSRKLYQEPKAFFVLDDIPHQAVHAEHQNSLMSQPPKPVYQQAAAASHPKTFNESATQTLWSTGASYTLSSNDLNKSARTWCDANSRELQCDTPTRP